MLGTWNSSEHHRDPTVGVAGGGGLVGINAVQESNDRLGVGSQQMSRRAGRLGAGALQRNREGTRKQTLQKETTPHGGSCHPRRPRSRHPTREENKLRGDVFKKR